MSKAGACEDLEDEDEEGILNHPSVLQIRNSIAILGGKERGLVTVLVHGKEREVCRKSLFMFSIDSCFRTNVLSFVEWRWFERFILLCIAINSVMLAIYDQRAPEDEGLNWVIDSIVDNILTAIFTLECMLKVIAWGFFVDKKSYLRDYWNILDFVVVVSGIVGWLTVSGNNSGLSFLRLFRVLRPLRSLNAVPQMKVLVNTVICSVPRLGNVSVMGAFLFMVFGIIGIGLMSGIFYRQCRTTPNPVFENDCWSWNITGEERLCGGRYMCEAGGFCGGHEQDPDQFRPVFPNGTMQGFPWCTDSAQAKVFPQADWVHFDHIGGAVLLVFQCMTLEGWIDIMYMVQDGYSTVLGVIYFYLIVTLTNYFMLNVALAVVDEARDDFEDGSSIAETHAPPQMLDEILSENEELAEHVLWYDNKYIRLIYRFSIWEPFTNFIMLIIAGNVVSMMLECFPPQVAWAPVLDVLGIVFLVIFILEMIVQLLALGPKGYVTNVATAFDGFVVIVSIIEQVLGGSSGLKSLRTLRFFRVLGKLAKKWQAFGILLKAMMHTGLALRYWLVLFILVLYIFTLMWIQFFALELHFKDPDSVAEVDGTQGQFWCAGNEDMPWNHRMDCIPRAHFDTFLWGFVTVFQIMTGENWNTIMYGGMRAKGWPYAIMYMGIILFGQILFLSLFLSMLISKFDQVQDEFEEAAFAKSDAIKAALAARTPSSIKSPGLAASILARIFSKKSRQVAPGPGTDGSSDEARSREKDPSTVAWSHDAEILAGSKGSLNASATTASTEKETQDQEKMEGQKALRSKDSPPQGRPQWPHGYSWFVASHSNPLRKVANKIIDFELRGSKVFDNFILFCILISSVFMALDNPLSDPAKWYVAMFRQADRAFAVIFIVEMVVKLCAYPLVWGKDAYLSSGWNWLDAAVVLVSVLEFVTVQGAGFLKTLRIIRALRPLRVIARNQNLKAVVQTVFASLQDLVSLVIVFTLILLIFALFALMYLNGQFYRCQEEVRFMASSTDNFVTPLCLGSNITDSSVALGSWVHPYSWDTTDASCSGPQLSMPWQRASADTPMCIARCDPLRSATPAPTWLCPRRYETTAELPSVCLDPTAIPTAAEAVGIAYVEAMTRKLVVPCGGSTVGGPNSTLVHSATAVSCRANFCPQGASEELKQECASNCRIHPTFCSSTCVENSGSGACHSCLEECQASCECQPYCEPLIRDAALCEEQGSNWVPSLPQNFNNIINAMITLFEISTTEGWADVMYVAADTVDYYRQPLRDNQQGLWAPFFVLWIFISFMFLINLSVGVIVDKFMDFRAQGKNMMLTERQVKWVESRKSLHRRMLFFDLCDLHLLHPFRRKVYAFISNKKFENTILACIATNTVLMSLKIYPAPAVWWEDMLEGFNLFFAAVFLIEAVLKLYALRGNYWKDNWNKFDFTVVAATIIGMAIKYGTGMNVASITSVIRIFRIARLFRLLRFMKGLSRLFSTLFISLPKLVNVVLILLLLLVLFSILGVSLFSCVKLSDTLNVHGNFRDFFWAFITLFRCSTGEAWNNIMHDLSKDEATYFREGDWCTPADLFDWQENYDVLKNKCLIENPNMCVVASSFGHTWIPKAYFIAYTLIISLMIMNLVIAVILEGYEEGKTSPSGEAIDTCVDVWKKYDPDHTMYLSVHRVIELINEVLLHLLGKGHCMRVPRLTFKDNGTIDFGSFPMKFAVVFDLKVTDDNQVSFISVCRQVLRLSVIEKDLGLVAEINSADKQLNPTDFVKLHKSERHTSQLVTEDLLQRIAVVKMQRNVRARLLYKTALKENCTQAEAFAVSTFSTNQREPQVLASPQSELRVAAHEQNGSSSSRQQQQQAEMAIAG